MIPLNNVGDFTGPEFTTDALYGLRNWQVRDEQLRSVAKPYSWTPGTNVAWCHTRGCPCDGCTFAVSERTPMWPPAGHDILTCPSRCGFYAYFREDPNRQWASHTNAVGVVEFTGRIFVGTKGLRGERARVVALACPQQAPDRRPASDYTDAMQWANHQVYLYQMQRRFEAVAQLPTIAAEFGVPWFETVDQMLAEVPLTSAAEFRAEEAS